MRDDHHGDFQNYVTARPPAMRYFAYLSCGDWHRAEDATQIAFERLYGAWHRARRDSLDAYTRRIIVNTLINEGRRGWFRRERSAAAMPEPPPDDHAPDERLSLLEALARLPARCRATVVLRYWEDLSVAETAVVMRCSESTVKTQTARALRTLRDLLSISAEGAAR
ncbi:RNA polymerase sigma-70 factor, sigma-E family [Stackebrandtia soli]